MSCGLTGDALLILVSPSESSSPDSCGTDSSLAFAVSISIWLCILAQLRLMRAICPIAASTADAAVRAVPCMTSHRATTDATPFLASLLASVTAPISNCSSWTSASACSNLSCSSLNIGVFGAVGSFPAPSILLCQCSKISLHSSLICAEVKFLICVVSRSSCF